MGFHTAGGRSAALMSSSRPLLFAAGAALLLAGCQTQQPATMAAAQPRGASVAFDSIDGLPPQHFKTLVDDLNEQAQARRVAITSRLQPAAYHVRGYFAAAVEKDRTTVSWVWDVFDRDERRALRISGSAPANGPDWNGADSALMQKIAASSMDELAGFLNSPAVASDAPPAPAGPALALTGDGSPEAAGIFRVAHTDPLPGDPAKAAAR